MRPCLIVSYAYPPSSSPGAVRMARLVARLPDHGWQPHVVTVGKAALVRSQGLADPLAQKPERVLRVDDPLARAGASAGSATTGQGGTGPSAKVILRQLAQAALFPDRTMPWGLAVQRRAGALRDVKPDVVLSTSPSLSCHRAAQKIARKLSARWVAEFRDPNSWLPEQDETGAMKRRLLAGLERKVVARADTTVTISEAFSEYFRSIYPDARIRTVANGTEFDPQAIAERMAERSRRIEQRAPGAPLVLAHAGAMYGGVRDPGPLIEAAMKAATQLDRPVRLRFIGGDSDLAVDKAMALGAGELVESVGPLTHAATVTETEKADAVVALLHRDPVARIGIMSKFFDYVATANPVLVVGERQAMLSRIVEDEGAGASREYSDVDGMAGWIVQLGQSPASMTYDALSICEKWSADAMARAMAGVFDEVMEG